MSLRTMGEKIFIAVGVIFTVLLSSKGETLHKMFTKKALVRLSKDSLFYLLLFFGTSPLLELFTNAHFSFFSLY